MTLPKEELLKIFQTAKDVEQDETCARIVGINMEGPFLDPSKREPMWKVISANRTLNFQRMQ